MFSTVIPATLAQTITTVHADGKEWLARFPAQLATWQAQWQLDLAPPFPNLSYNYVAPGIQAGKRRVVLKAGPPSVELQCEIAALQHYDGKGAVRLLAADAQNGALLLERISPGTSLIEEPDDRCATEIAAQVMQQLWQAQATAPASPTDAHSFVAQPLVTESLVKQPFVTVADWAKGLQRLRTQFHGQTGPLPPKLVEKAERLFEELLASMDTPVLLHGDLHHENILAARLSSSHTNWLAIDPKGVWGEPAYEPGAWLRNPISRILERTQE